MEITEKRKKLLILLGAALLLALAWGLPASGFLNPYVVQILMYVGINMILTLSLNLVNGYMGEFSVGHAGFMGIGAYVASVLTVAVLPRAWAAPAFPAVLVCGGAAAAVAGLVVAYPSFRTRGDYLAIVTLAFNMIVKSVLENISSPGRPPGLSGHAPPHHALLGGRLGDASLCGSCATWSIPTSAGGSPPSGKTKWPPT